VSAVRARNPINVSASGNVPPPIPASTIHSHAPPVGAAARPVYAMRLQAQNAVITARWCCGGTRGATSETGMPTAENTATIAPAVLWSMPWSLRKRANQPKAM
jgi:hypothetical protein